MPSISPLPLVDRLIPGGLEKFLLDAREDGQSYRTIAARLRDEHDIPTTQQTVMAWCRSYEIEKPAAD